MYPRKFLLLISFSFFLINGDAQDKSNVKFGKISPVDFANKVYSIDSNAAAIVIADIGSCDPSDIGEVTFKRYTRIHILNKNGYNAANIQLALYTGDEKDDGAIELKATTYNLENGKVVETKVEKSSIFKDRLTKNIVARKFAFPNVKEGSIIEYECKIEFGFMNFQPWTFQGEYPVLWSEYSASIPQFANYIFLTQGYQPFYINTKKIGSGITDYRWVMKDVPAIKEESYTSTINNHIARVTLQLSSVGYPYTPQRVLNSWEDVCGRLLKNVNFGTDLNDMNVWLGDVVKPLLTKGMNDLEKTKQIFAYVRDNFACAYHGDMYLSQTLKNILKTKRGNVADLNLFLIAMLHYANINAEPVILSTRSHGYTYSIYPILEKFNYVICVAHIDQQDIYLDASWPRLGFGKLTPECYNGHARIVNETATAISFSPDSLLERKATNVSLTIDDKGEMKGSFQQMPGYLESHSIREKIKEKGEEEYFKNLKQEFDQGLELVDPKIDSIDKLDGNINISYGFKLKTNNEDIIYISPILKEGYKQNPFKSAERFYPVEMPYTINNLYSFTLNIPANYKIDELPESIVIKYNDEGDGYFEYKVFRSDEAVTIRSRIVFKRTFYQPEEYEVLREFFNMIVNKQNEQIVLKKK